MFVLKPVPFMPKPVPFGIERSSVQANAHTFRG
jgi:hypothetical protein